MKNQTLIFVVIAVAVAGLGAYMLSQNSTQSDPTTKKEEVVVQKNTQETMEKKEDKAIVKTSEEKMATGSRYVGYSKTALEKNATNRRVLFFYASWCPTCKPADADFQKNESKIPEDVTIIRVNYNDPETDQEEKDLAKKYGITYQHTYVQIDSTGKEVVKWNGGQMEELLSNIK